MNPFKKAFSLLFAVTCLPFVSVHALAQSDTPLLLPQANFPRVTSNEVNANSPVIGSPIDDISPEDAAFQEALKSVAPLSPDQIREMRSRLDAVEKANGLPLATLNPVTRSVSVSLKSGERPAVLKVSPGWISTLTFSDVTGQPWPVLSVTNGNPEAYSIQSSGPENSTNIVTISARQAYIPSNIAITLVGAKVPILMTLDPSSTSVDYRVDAQVDQRGPHASYDVISSDGLSPTDDSTMLSFLDGVPPDSAQRLKSGSREVQSWRFNDMVYIRTTRTLLSPAYVRKQSNASGVNVYVMKEAPVLLLSDAGRTEYVRIDR